MQGDGTSISGWTGSANTRERDVPNTSLANSAFSTIVEWYDFTLHPRLDTALPWCLSDSLGELSHRCPLIVVNQVTPESIRTAAHDIACGASELHVLAVRTCAFD